jgi:hypothetical protein
MSENSSPVALLVNQITTDLFTNLSKSRQVVQQVSVEFQCPFRTDFRFVDITKDEENQQQFRELMELKGPVLYWFEVTSNHTAIELREAIEGYKGQPNARRTPAFKRAFSPDSRCLYVGKAKRSFYGRVIQHLGFEQSGSSQGMQIYHWANDMRLKVSVHGFELAPAMIDLVSIMEIEFAKHMKPIFGKH